MRCGCCFLLVCAALLAAPGMGSAAEGRSPITISADTLELNRKARVAVYRGGVAANDLARGISILADQIEFFFDERMEELERAVWGDAPPDSDAVRTHLHLLRAAIDKPFAQPLLRTLRGIGWQIAPPDAQSQPTVR